MAAITALANAGQRKCGQGAGEGRPARPSTDLGVYNGFISPLQVPTAMGAPGRTGTQYCVGFINIYGTCWCMDMYFEGRKGIMPGMSAQKNKRFDG